MARQVVEGAALRSTADKRLGDEPVPDRTASYVLVVDDEPVVRDFLVRCLEGWGYSARPASSAAEALELMVEKPASLVLCDIRLPGQDGLWLSERLRAHWPNTPIVMASAIDDVETVRQSQEIGAVDYITKPIEPEALRQVVRRATAIQVEVIEENEEDEKEAESASAPSEPAAASAKFDAEYTLESPLKCPACGERITSLKAVRLIRAQVNFVSTLPRRGRVIACPHCLSVIPAELTNF